MENQRLKSELDEMRQNVERLRWENQQIEQKTGFHCQQLEARISLLTSSNEKLANENSSHLAECDRISHQLKVKYVFWWENMKISYYNRKLKTSYNKIRKLYPKMNTTNSL